MYSIPLEIMPREARELPPNEVAYLIKLGLLSQQSMLTPKMFSNEPTFLDKTSTKTAALIGQTGEQIVRDIYEKKYIVENVSKQGRTGDMWIKRPVTPQHPIQHQILIEVKNYTSPVGTQEVDKFYRDLSANSSIVGGVFISLNTPITGFQNNFHFTYRGDTPVVFIWFESNSESNDEIIMLAADLIWAFVDSKSIVDEQIFQKLSTKLTKLSDCLNNLSMCRTYITETRTLLDKQMSKIYENVLSGEMQMRQIIRSINKTLTGGSQESFRGLKFMLHELSSAMLEKLINNKFVGTLLNTNDVHKETVNNIVQTYFTCFTDNEIIHIDVDKKDIIFRHKHQVLMVLGVLKTRTDISFQLHVVPSTLNIMPGIASYTNGMITFQIDKNTLTDSSLERILRCIQDMYDQDLIGKLDDPTPFNDLDE